MPSIASSSASQLLPAAKTATPAETRAVRVPNWVQAIPFAAVHLVCLAAVWTGVGLTAVILCAVLYVVRMFAVTAGYHRYFAHRSYRTSRAFQFFLAVLGCTAMQKGPLWWAAHHRHHHKHSDTDLDPHSPVQRGFWWSHVGWVLAEDYNETDWGAIKDWTKYPELVWLNRLYWVPPLILGVVIWWALGWSALIVGYFVSTVLLYHGTFLVNSLCHVFGKRRYQTTDQSRNNWLVAILTLGEGWHNNHHHYQSAACQGFFWWEIDLSYYALKGLEVFGVVWDVRRPPKRLLQENAK